MVLALKLLSGPKDTVFESVGALDQRGLDLPEWGDIFALVLQRLDIPRVAQVQVGGFLRFGKVLAKLGLSPL
jgi:hypothetical protein